MRAIVFEFGHFFALEDADLALTGAGAVGGFRLALIRIF